ncbi:MAG: Gfo/Idh/MocA family oxidoreductase [Trueperaceae bacterium]|nr:Gfo/Idh/MocA family oxidoreductase [Trueperaceae bacterium]
MPLVPDPTLDLPHDVLPAWPAKTDYAIGCVGAGFIMRDVQLVAYREAGLNVAALASRTPRHARDVAVARGVPKTYDTYPELLADPSIEIVDIAVPPRVQAEVVREAVRHPHVRGILAQKPLAPTLEEAAEVVRTCEQAGIPLAVNQNMRFDHGIRALAKLLERGVLGTPVLATIEMRAVPHWQDYLRGEDRLTLLNMSIHHLDAFRFLFGQPERVFASARSDPRTTFPHRDGIALYVLEYAGGLRAAGWDDVWAGPGEGAARNDHIRWRVEGTDGMAQGTVGWPAFPQRVPSTIDVSSVHGGGWYRPRWPYAWFPDAFAGPMAALMRAVHDGEPVAEVNGRDNLATMALVEACYRSLEERRAVPLEEISSG